MSSEKELNPPCVITSPLPPSLFSFQQEKWYDRMSYEDACYILHWNRKRELEYQLERKEVPQEEIQILLKGYHITRHQYFERIVHSYIPLNIRIPITMTKYDKLITWCMTNKIPKGSRTKWLFPNLALLLMKKHSEYEAEKAATVIMNNAHNCQNRRSIQYWMKYFKRNPQYSVNEALIYKWAKVHNIRY